MPSSLKQGQQLKSVFGPLNTAGTHVGATIEWSSITSIVVGQLAGPMGWYDVAIIHYKDYEDDIIPLHMAEQITVKEAPDA